jgi:hypothetical protein
MTTALAFAPMYNTGSKKDATGAFQPEAKLWLKSMSDNNEVSGDLVLVDNHMTAAKMRGFVMGEITKTDPDYLAFFCHGWPTGIQFGFGLAHVNVLAEAIKSKYTKEGPCVTLYGCLTGSGPADGDGNFADRLRDALCQVGETYCVVDAHTTAGHTTRNPYVRRFDGLGSNSGGTGGQWIVAPNSKLWKKWKKALTGDLRFRFPYMEIVDIHDELEQMP